MRTGDARPSAPVRCQRGFTYLWLLFVLAIGATGAAALGERASKAVHREREAELMFRGQAIARALSAYEAATPGDAKVLPTTLDDLLEDRRGLQPAYHLRRLYADPFTGRPDWVLIKNDAQRIEGVRSRAAIAALRVVDLPPPGPGRVVLVSDRVFTVTQAAADKPSPAPPE